MTLEDFFTLTEMKDGLTTPGRVEELVTVMQKEKDYVVKNVGEATRQWSTVASTIAATENRECLNRFIQLDGLWFFNRWLKDAQKFCNDTNDSFVEESITALLRALERLHIDNEKLFSSGIWISIKNLLGHNSSTVQDSARALFDSWKWVKDSNEVSHVDEVVAVGASHDDGTAVIAELGRKRGLRPFSATDFKESANEGNLVEDDRDENLPTRTSDDLQVKEVTDVQSETSKFQANSLITLDHADIKDRTPEALASAAVLNPVPENVSKKDELPVVPAEGITSIETCSSTDIKDECNEKKSDVQRLDVSSDDGKPTNMIESSPKCPVAMKNISSSWTIEAGPVFSRADAANAGESSNELTIQTNISAKDGYLRVKSASNGDVGTPLSEAKSGVDNSLIHCRAGGAEDPEITFSRIEDAISVEEDEEHASDRDMAEASDFLKLAMDSKGSDIIDKRSDIDLEYGLVDALEVARRVAKAVEREVGEYGEPFCSSSSEKISEGSTEQPGSPESINEKDNKSSESRQTKISSGKNPSVESCPRMEANLHSSDDVDNEPDNCIHDIESSQVTEAAQEPEGNTEKGMWDFDLNQEVCSDDVDRSLNTVSVVSASRAVAVPGLHAAPLHFEGTLGWKGSAATSAFRPASPWKITDGDKISTGGASGSPKQRHDILDIDLNVAEEGYDKNGDLIPGKQLPVSFGLPSGESSVEMSPRKSKRLKLDLNRTDDEGDVPAADWRMDGLLSHGRNGHRSPSPASSSSSMQPFFRNIDLNDRPSIHYDMSDQQPYFRKSSSQYENAHGGLKPVDPVISIMGTRVEVNRKDFVPQFMSLSKGKASDAGMDVNLTRIGGFQAVGRPTMSYTHSPAYGYNGLTTGPSMSFYAPGSSIPYMVDSRGAPVVPQIMGYAPAVPPAYSQQQFITSMTGAPPALNGTGPLPTNFDLNSGFMSEGGNRDAGGSMQLFLPGRGRSMEEHLRDDLQPSSSSGIGGKRKEPNGGWEPYPFNLKHHQPPWK